MGISVCPPSDCMTTQEFFIGIMAAVPRPVPAPRIPRFANLIACLCFIERVLSVGTVQAHACSAKSFKIINFFGFCFFKKLLKSSFKEPLVKLALNLSCSTIPAIPHTCISAIYGLNPQLLASSSVVAVSCKMLVLQVYTSHNLILSSSSSK